MHVTDLLVSTVISLLPYVCVMSGRNAPQLCTMAALAVCKVFVLRACGQWSELGEEGHSY